MKEIKDLAYYDKKGLRGYYYELDKGYFVLKIIEVGGDVTKSYYKAEDRVEAKKELLKKLDKMYKD